MFIGTWQSVPRDILKLHLCLHALVAITKATVLVNGELVDEDRQSLNVQILIRAPVLLLIFIFFFKIITCVTSLKQLPQMVGQFQRGLEDII